MKIKPFAVEEWMNEYETEARFNIAETCVDSVSLDELFLLSGTDRASFFSSLSSKRLTYGDIAGSEALLKGIAGLYHKIGSAQVVPTHGAAGANDHVFCSLISPGGHVISIMPTYQQLYSIPESLGARVDIIKLRREDGYVLDLDELKSRVTSDTKMICINNPDNPTGAVIPNDLLEKIAGIAGEANAYLLCDEVYRHLTQEDGWCESVADIYEKGISVSSMSKVFSLAGIRMGWIATRDTKALSAFRSHRDYDLISCGMIDDAVASLALSCSDKLLERNRKIIRDNLRTLDDWISHSTHFSYVKPQAGTTALIHYDFNIPSYEFCTRMYAETGAFVTPGDCFEEPFCFRIGYGCDADTLKNGLRAISDFAEKL